MPMHGRRELTRIIHSPDHEEYLINDASIPVGDGRPACAAEAPLNGITAVSRSFQIAKTDIFGIEADEGGDRCAAGPPAIRAMAIGSVEWLRFRLELDGAAPAAACMYLQG